MTTFRDGLFAAFFDHQDGLKRFLRRRLGNAALAEDLTQETWLRAAAANAAPIENPKSYLFRVAANLANDHLRRARHGIELQGQESVVPFYADPRPSPEQQAAGRSELQRLLRAVDGLSPRAREVFILAKVHELSHAEIALRLGIAKNTVMVHMANALEYLHMHFQRDAD
ncbi:RNA polymerase sigma factor [Ferrovibrio terrae]|uniref:RNA polymerase sigma factor n=1 Tax=Ferrovibrio terrae TaxID=2594003 RepID=UPI003137F5CD